MSRWPLACIAVLMGCTSGALAATTAEIVSLEGKGEYREAQVSTWRAATL